MLHLICKYILTIVSGDQSVTNQYGIVVTNIPFSGKLIIVLLKRYSRQRYCLYFRTWLSLGIYHPLSHAAGRVYCDRV